MGKHELIYSKEYPVSSLEDFEIDTEEMEEENSGFFKQLRENSTFVLNEEKEKKKDVFIETVKILADTYETDIEIYEEEWGYVANLRIGIWLGSGYAKDVLIKALMVADNFTIVKNVKKDKKNEHDILLLLDYSTYDRCFKGRKSAFSE